MRECQEFQSATALKREAEEDWAERNALSRPLAVGLPPKADMT